VAVASLVFFATAQYCRQLYLNSYFDLFAGRYVAGHGGIPERNVVTVMAHGQPWIDQQWLAQLIDYLAWRVGGYPAFVALSIALVSAGMTLLGVLMLRRGASPLLMCGWTLAAVAVSYGYATPRSQTFAYLFVPATMWLVLRDDGRRWPRASAWLSIPLLVVWANVHGSVLVGAGLVGLHAARGAGRALRHGDRRGLGSYLLLGAGAAASPFCTPYGFEIVRYYASLIGNPVLADSAGGEWAPPNLFSSYSWAFFAVVIAVAAATVVGWRRGVRPHPEIAIFAVVTLGMALLAFRNTPWFGFAGCLLAADMLARRAAPRTPARSFRWMLAAAMTTVAVVMAISLAREPAGQYEASIPRHAVDVAARLGATHPGPVLADKFGAVGLLWLHPASFGRVAFDARDEQYSQAQLAAIFGFINAEGPHWQQILRGYDIVVVSRQDPRLAAAMTRLPGWKVVYADDSGRVLERTR
jgi:hypothetical protein